MNAEQLDAFCKEPGRTLPELNKLLMYYWMNNSLAKLLLLMPTHSTSQFSCGIVSLDTYLLEKALQNHKKQGARTFVVADCVIGYFTLGYRSVSSVSSALAPGQKNYLPLMFLTKLAVDKNE